MSITGAEVGARRRTIAKTKGPATLVGSAQRLGPGARLGLSLLLVAAATLVAFVVDNVIAAPNLTLIYVLPVVVAATAFGWLSALVAAIAGVASFDFFFTRPYFSFRISSPSDIWAAGLLLAVAAIVSTVAGESRRRAAEARRAAERSGALQALAHGVIEGRPSSELVAAAAEALHSIFRAPAVVFVEAAGILAPEAIAGDGDVGPAVTEAARGALAGRVHTRGGAYPYDQSPFDLWPVTGRGGRGLVLGVDFSRAEDDRPETPERFVDIVAGYLAAAPATDR